MLLLDVFYYLEIIMVIKFPVIALVCVVILALANFTSVSLLVFCLSLANASVVTLMMFELAASNCWVLLHNDASKNERDVLYVNSVVSGGIG